MSAAEIAVLGLAYAALLGLIGMVVSFYLRCPHCGSLRGSNTDPPKPVRLPEVGRDRVRL